MLFLICPTFWTHYLTYRFIPAGREVKNRFKASMKYGDVCRSSQCWRSNEVLCFPLLLYMWDSLCSWLINSKENVLKGWNEGFSLQNGNVWHVFQEFLWEKAQSLSQGDSYWVGLRSSGADGDWQWSDGSLLEKGPQWVWWQAWGRGGGGAGQTVCADLSSLSLSQAEDILPDQLSGHKTMRGLDIKNVCVPVHSQTFLVV